MPSRPSSNLRPGVDYPATYPEFERFFATEAACLAYLEGLRWPGGFRCPACGELGRAWRTRRGLLVCGACEKHVSVTAGTIFEKTRKPLRTWFQVAWEITNRKYGANALDIQRRLGFGSYQTAWAWLHKFRRAMVRPDRDGLEGRVEVDESYVGGGETGVHGRQTFTKAIVAIAVERRGRRTGRIRLGHVPDVTAKSLVPFVESGVQRGATVLTDGWGAYSQLSAKGFVHEVTVLSASPDPAHVLMPGVHLVASLLKRWLLGTFQGAVSREHLAYYLDEFTFRYNRRGSKARGLLFYRLLEQAAQTGHTSTRSLYLGTGRGRRGSPPGQDESVEPHM